MIITDEERWNAVINNDKNYDGIFFYAVKSTGIYCKPSCKSKLPKRENVSFFDLSEDAQNEGFRPCKRCRSDLSIFHPTKDIAEKLKTTLDSLFLNQLKIDATIRNLGLSHQRIVELFKDEYGMTPKSYTNHLKIEEVKRLLRDTDDDILTIAFSVGFNSLSAFYRFFKNHTGTTPKVYRKAEKI